MISNLLKPKTKHELIRSLNKIRISQVDVIEPYDATMTDRVATMAKAMAAKSGQVSIIILRSP